MAFVCVPRDWTTVEPRRRWHSPDRRFWLSSENGNSGRWMLFDRERWTYSVRYATGEIDVRNQTKAFDTLTDALAWADGSHWALNTFGDTPFTTGYRTEAEARAEAESTAGMVERGDLKVSAVAIR